MFLILNFITWLQCVNHACANENLGRNILLVCL